jgi:hypothetical protein
MIDVAKILAELKEEKEQLEQAILTLERLAVGRGPRRGRPPGWMSDEGAPKRRGRPPGSKNKPAAPAETAEDLDTAEDLETAKDPKKVA